MTFRKQILKKPNWKVPVEIFTKSGNNKAMLMNVEWILKGLGLIHGQDKRKEKKKELPRRTEQTELQGWDSQ